VTFLRAELPEETTAFEDAHSWSAALKASAEPQPATLEDEDKIG